MALQRRHTGEPAETHLRRTRLDSLTRNADRRAGLLPFTGSVLAVAGLILLVAGMPILALPEPPDPETRARAQAEVSTPPVAAIRNPRRLSYTACPCPEIHPSARRSAATPPPLRAVRSSLWESTALFPGDEQIPNPTLPDEEWDARWGLMEMAGAQRGHWARLCPCPVYAPDTKTGPR